MFQFVIENGVLPCLYQLLDQNHKKSIKKEACWTISNITAGNKAQIQVKYLLRLHFVLWVKVLYSHLTTTGDLFYYIIVIIKLKIKSDNLSFLFLVIMSLRGCHYYLQSMHSFLSSSV